MDIDILFGRALFGLIGVAILILLIIFLIGKIRSTKKKTANYVFSTDFNNEEEKEEVDNGVITKKYDRDYL